MCLEAVELDLALLSQVAAPEHAQEIAYSLSDLRTIPSLSSLRQQSLDGIDTSFLGYLINHSMVGHFLCRTGGRLGQLTYLVTPAQSAFYNVSSTRPPRAGSGSDSGVLGGYVARVGIRPPSASESVRLQQLAFMPLVTLHEDTCGNRIPEFAQLDEISCVSLEAELVLYLDPPVPLTTAAVRQLEEITGLPIPDCQSGAEEDLVRCILRRQDQEHLFGINTRLQLPNQTQHSYAVKSQCRGYLVREIPFTCSRQLGPIIGILRQHASWTAFVETFLVHPQKPIEKDETLAFAFTVSLPSPEKLDVSFQHPTDPTRTVLVNVEIGPFQVKKVTVCNASNQCNDIAVEAPMAKLLTRVHSLPIGLVRLLTDLGCPIHSELKPKGTKTGDKENNPNNPEAEKNTCPVNPRLMQHLRSMLSRARSHVVIQGATGTGGVLSGADCLDTQSHTSQPTVMTSTAIKLPPPLPPGVLAITPPPSLPQSTGTTNLNSRSLRLDDLLVDNVFSQPGGTSTSDVVNFLPSTSSGYWPSKSSLSRELLADSLASPPVVSSVKPSVPNFLSPGSYASRLTPYQCNGSAGPRGFSSTSSVVSPPAAVQKYSSLSPGSKVSGNNSGSMLVNLLNEEPPPSSNILLSQLPPNSTRYPYQNTAQLTSDSSPANRLPGVYPTTSPSLPSPIGAKLPGTNSSNSPPIGTKSQAYPGLLPGAGKTKSSLTPSSSGVPGQKKQRKKHKLGAQMSDSSTPVSLISSTPRSFAPKHQRADLTYHRQSNAPPLPNMAATSATTGLSFQTPSTSISSSGKSVYDFDDTPSSTFEMTASYTCPSGASASKHSSTASNSSLMSSSSSSSHALTGGSAVGLPERTVERKASLKVTIKTLPAQSHSDTYKFTGENTSGKVGQPIKRRKKRSVEGKPTSYMMQMLQQTPSSSGKVVKAPASLVGHASMLVKKERKKRAYNLTGKSKPAVVATSDVAMSVPSQHSSLDTQKPIERDGVKLPTPMSTSALISPVKSQLVSSLLQKKKSIPTTSGSLLSAELQMGKRPLPSPSQPEDLKRKKHSMLSKAASIDAGAMSQYDMLENFESYNQSEPVKIPKTSQFAHRGVTGLKKARSIPPVKSASGSTVAHSTGGGLIKGYKIPKKKTITSPISHSSISQLHGTNNTLDSSQSVDQSRNPTPSSTPSLSTSHSTSELTSGPNDSVAGPAETAPPLFPPSGHKKQTMKSISDIVDKLRAKSSSSGALCTSQTAYGQNEAGQLPEDSGSNVEKSNPQDPRGDNIFEKFYSIETPTSSATELNRTFAGSDVVRSQPDCPTTSSVKNSTSTTNTTSVPATEESRTAEQDSRRSFELIKADTDTPASPTETNPADGSNPPNSTSKVIPISPRRLTGSGTTGSVKHGMHHPRKLRGSGLRFPRAPLASGAGMHHIGDGYMRAGHLRGVRPSRSYQHAMHRPKTAGFKNGVNWSNNGPPDPGPMAPWMMPQGSGGNQPPMPPHPFHPGGMQRPPMRPPFGNQGGPGNMYGGGGGPM